MRHILLCTSAVLLGSLPFAHAQQTGLTFGARPATPGQTGARRGPSPIMPKAVSPEVHPDRTVTFRLYAPTATSVKLSLQGAPAGVGTGGDIKKGDDGVWTLTTGALPPDVYNYFFLVDGLVVPDPANTEVRFRHWGETVGLSTVEVPNSPADAWDVQPVRHGSVVHATYTSKVIGAERPYEVYLPAGYDAKRKEPYPVVYLLHGLTEDSTAWFTVGKANIIADNFIAQGKLKPVVMVAPTGYGITTDINALYSEKEIQADHLAKYTQALLTEVMPAVERDFNISKDRRTRAIAGLSMGGGQAMSIGLAHPELFAYVGGMSPALVMLDSSVDKAFPTVSAKANANQTIFFTCGVDDGLIAASRVMKDFLDKRAVKYEFVETPGMHTWPVFRRGFTSFSQKLFQ